MKKTFRWGLLLATCLLMTLGLLAGPPMAVQAATYPGLFYGTATVDDEPVQAGTEITAWVGTEQVGSAFTGVDNLDANQFALSVDLEAGLEVSFKIGELDAIETVAFVLYVPQVVSLTAYTEVTLVSIAVTPGGASVLVGETRQFTATGTFSDDSTADITAEAAWTSSDTAVATVELGLTTGLALGTATITATLGGISESASLEVSESVEVVTVELIEGVNIIPYTGATTSLPEALTNIGPGDGSGVVQIIWARAVWTEGSWLYYNAAIPWGTLSQLENGRAYIIVVSQDCTWEIPQ